MKYRNTSSQDNDELELLIAAGIENVTAVQNGIAFNGKTQLTLDYQKDLNEVYQEAQSRVSQHRTS